jgi:hypothetical protein
MSTTASAGSPSTVISKPPITPSATTTVHLPSLTYSVPTPSSTAQCTRGGFHSPPDVPGCIVPARGNSSLAMVECCGTAQVFLFDDCYFYCAAKDKPNDKLLDCLSDAVGGNNTEEAPVCFGPLHSQATGSAAISPLQTATSTGGAPAFGYVGETRVSKAVIGTLAVLALGSFAGMFL